MSQTTLLEINYARNAYNGAVTAAQGFTSGQRVYNVKATERALRNLLCAHRDEIAALIREKVA